MSALNSLKINIDARGILQVLNLDGAFPINVARIFIISDVPRWESRGNHAHYKCKQFFWLAQGGLTVETLNTDGRKIQDLNESNRILLVPELTWVKLNHFQDGTVLVVLASDLYDPADYIDDIKKFNSIVGVK